MIAAARAVSPERTVRPRADARSERLIERIQAARADILEATPTEEVVDAEREIRRAVMQRFRL
ncbi:hypothetical protein [Methylobacterium sp. yr668]|uniref:hypothetical protein n=1 Tax=Methylobacterium sp. yr668 TaxID=1761801 RepID=UPI0008E70282|nr:hypothetical protein [Methylobacterium sp. yr668]SFT11622.1 hypothetical protein SAMN04487845_11711 [Methylobacterium sp. yr668]